MPSRFLVASVAWLLWSAATAAVQTVGATTGAADGTVTDGTGAVLPGVAVTASSDALMVPRTAVSAPDGSFRFSALPPGTYTLTFTLAGFERTTRADVRVGVGFTVTVDLRLDTARHGEVLSVQGSTGLGDRRRATLATDLDATDLADLPGSRSIGVLLAVTPSVQLTRFDVGGNTAFSPGPFSVYGTSGYNRPVIEGISVSGMNPYGFALDYGTFASASVGAGAYGPEWPSPGLHMQIITRSGGNRTSGSIYAAYEDGDWQARNIDRRQIERGAAGAPGLPAEEGNRLQFYRDLNADAGGYLRKDRVWWYGSAREHAASIWQVSFPVTPIETQILSLTAKGTWRLSDENRVVVFAQGGRNEQAVRLDGFLRGPAARNHAVDSTVSQLARGVVWKAEWSGSVGSQLFLEARVGQFVASRAERPNGFAPRVEDLQRSEVSGGNRDWLDQLGSDQLTGAASYFRDTRLGRHQFELGVQVQRSTAVEEWRRAYPGDVLHVTQNGEPREVYLFQSPSRSVSGQWWYGLHAEDTWQIGNRLTLSPGVRFDRLRVYLPAQHHPAGRFNAVPQSFSAVDEVAAWNVVAPRIGVSYDLRGNGQTLVKSSYGLYWLPPTTDLGFNVNPNGRVWWERFRWADADGDGTWQRGEEFERLDKRGGEVSESIDPEMKLAYVHEVTGRVEREVTPGLLVGGGVVWRLDRQHGTRQRANWPLEAFDVPVLVRDPGPDAIFGTADDGAPIGAFELAPDLLGRSQIVVGNVANSESEHLTWEVVARRRFSGRWSLFGSFGHTWSRDHAREFFGQAVRGNEYPLTPNDYINTDPGGRHVYRSWSARLLATVEGFWGMRLTPFVRHQSGQPFGRIVQARLNYGVVPVLVEPVGTRRQRHVTLVDLRVDKDVWRMERRRVTTFVEAFNALNANPEQNVSWESAAFLRPLAIVPPRLLRIGLAVEW